MKLKKNRLTRWDAGDEPWPRQVAEAPTLRTCQSIRVASKWNFVVIKAGREGIRPWLLRGGVPRGGRAVVVVLIFRGALLGRAVLAVAAAVSAAAPGGAAVFVLATSTASTAIVFAA